MLTFGDKLKRERESRNTPLQKIATRTRIRIGYLEALERNEFDSLPGPLAFGKLYIRAYAEILGFDPGPLIAEYDRERLDQARKKRVAKPAKAPAGGSPIPAPRSLRKTPTAPTARPKPKAGNGRRPEPKADGGPTAETRKSPSKTSDETAPRKPRKPRQRPRREIEQAASTVTAEARPGAAAQPTEPAPEAPPKVAPLPPPPSPPSPLLKEPAASRPPDPSPPASPRPVAPPKPIAPPAAVVRKFRAPVWLVVPASLAVLLLLGALARVFLVSPPPQSAAVSSSPAEVSANPVDESPPDPSAQPVAASTGDLEEPDAPVSQTQAAAPTEDATASPDLVAQDYGVGTAVVDRRLVGQAERFEEGAVVWFATRITGGRRGENVRHVWLREGQPVQSIALKLGGPHWRTHSSKTLWGPGEWAVEARDAGGRVLARASFTCTPRGS